MKHLAPPLSPSLGTLLVLVLAASAAGAQAGPWSDHAISTAADNVQSVFAADVDGDGDLDGLSASAHDNTIAWYENAAGDGSAWVERTIATTAYWAICVFAADVDGDGDVDALSASAADDSIAWYENTAGDGSAWSEHALPTVDDSPESIFAADVDGDGDVDVLAAFFGNHKVRWYENTAGDGSAWTIRPVSFSAIGPRSVFAADVDGDGDLDALSASRYDDKIAWYENTSSFGAAWTEHVISVSTDEPTSVFAADVDGDGDVDALAGYAGTGDEVAWYENTAGDGSAWTAHPIVAPINNVHQVVAADVDRDGDVDALSASYTTDEIAWYENTAGDGSAWTEHDCSTAADGAESVFAADVDGDGDLDAFYAASLSDTVGWVEDLARTRQAAFCGASAISSTADYARSVFATDVDGDGDADALSASGNDDEIAWYENVSGDGSAWAEVTITTSADDAYAVCAADVDGDGDEDALSASRLDDTIAWYENTAGDGSAWTKHLISTAADRAHSVFAADVDRDGDVDALSATWGDNTIAWHENVAGDGSVWIAHVISIDADGAHSVVAADVDGDGDVDALSASSLDSWVAWHENVAGDGSVWTAHTIASKAHATSVFAADVDRDGDVDALSTSWEDDTVAWHENTAGDGSAWTEHAISTANNGPESVVAVDVDGDGDVDALCAVNIEDAVVWYENTAGDGTAWTAHVLTDAADAAYDVFAADVDGDGDVDALVASYNDDTIAWIDNVSAPALEVVRLGTPPNPSALLPGVTSAPVLGAVWDPVVDHTTFWPAAILDALGVSAAPANLPWPPLGTLLISPSPAPFYVTGPAGVPFAIPVPADCVFVGVGFATQGLTVDLPTGLHFANALDVTFGTY